MTAAAASAIVPRATVSTIVRNRDNALALYGRAHAALMAAREASDAAHDANRAINPRENKYNQHLHSEKVTFMTVGAAQPLADYMAVAKKIVDTEAWAYVLEITDLERLMDKEAKEKLRQQLLSDPIEATEDNIFATLETFAADAGTIFRRGVANCFSQLDRRFKSHDGFKIGSRLILDRMFDENGWWNHRRDMESTLLDIERAFFVIDDLPVPPAYSGIVGKLRESRQIGTGMRQSEVESDFFTIRIFKNGNCHVWFKRDDLLKKVNKLLAEYYGEVIPDGMTPEDDGGLNTPKTTPARHFGFFPTPKGVAETVIEYLKIRRDENAAPMTVLEPSAGTGNLSRPIARMLTPHGLGKRLPQRIAAVTCVEIQPQFVADLKAERIYNNVIGADFLALKPQASGLFDRVAMNPPFDRERDIDHVIHALKFLKPDGLLVAVMSAGTEFRETRKSIAFRALIGKMNGKFNDLPAGSFAAVGTNVNTITLRVYKDGHSFW